MEKVRENVERSIRAFTATEVGQASILKSSREKAEASPEVVRKTFYAYYCIIRDLFDLTPEELEVIKQVNDKLDSDRGADKFLEEIGKHKETVLKRIRDAGNLDNEVNRKGLDELTAMMGNAWEIKQADPEWIPADGDPKSDQVIWGFTKGTENPRTDIHFTICHGIERILTQHFRIKLGIEYVDHKDWLLVAMNDVVALRGLRGERYEGRVFDVWSQPRPQGLGWISQERADAYREALGIE